MVMRLTMASELGDIARILDAFDRFAGARSLDPRVRRRVGIALDEVLSNLVSYSGAEHIEVSAEVIAGQLVIEIADDGPPFDPTEARDADTSSSLAERSEGGLGVHLVMRMMDEVHYQRRDGKGVLRLIQTLPTVGPST